MKENVLKNVKLVRGHEMKNSNCSIFFAENTRNNLSNFPIVSKVYA